MGRFLGAITRNWLAEEMYGWKFAPTAVSFDFPFLYVKCLLYISSAGPGAARRQRDYVAGMIHATSGGAVDTDLLQYIDNFDRSLHRVPALADTQAGSARPAKSPKPQEPCHALSSGSFIRKPIRCSLLQRVPLRDPSPGGTPSVCQTKAQP